ncbi:rCG63537 [Rattus norvegicus]|uniref:RCG63537 n=1 Tax=Rattus norvegicus TaxID=10116 RepID=A6J8D3_RAT|nr:rCG63537 [Rattus norvegicus]
MAPQGQDGKDGWKLRCSPTHTWPCSPTVSGCPISHVPCLLRTVPRSHLFLHAMVAGCEVSWSLPHTQNHLAQGQKWTGEKEPLQ